MNEYILIVSDTEQADLLALLKKFSSVTLKRLADTPVSPEIQAFLDATRQGLKEVELYEKVSFENPSEIIISNGIMFVFDFLTEFF